MKYLIKYKKFESVSENICDPKEIKSDCEDILLELKDIGFKISISTDGQWIKGKDFAREPKSYIRVVISKLVSYESLPNQVIRDHSFDIKEVIEYINRIDNYLSSFDFKPSDDFGDRYSIRTDIRRNPNDFSVTGLYSFINLWYTREEE